jgi:cytochrome c oxidase cbb3-type subunit 3
MSEDKNKHPEEQILQEGDPDTTGHSWDGIKEFNNPLPRWWLWTFYATIVWGIGYTVCTPPGRWSNGATPGILGFSTRANVAEDIQRFDDMNADVRTRIAEVELAAINPTDNPDLYNYAIQGGAATFATWCSQCHGSGAAGAGLGYPNLLDDDWLWGGTIEDVHMTISHGIRNEDDMNARYSEMTAFEGILTDEEIGAVVQYVRNISGQEHDERHGRAGRSGVLRQLRVVPHGRGHRGPVPRRAEPDGCDLALRRLGRGHRVHGPQRPLRRDAAVVGRCFGRRSSQRGGGPFGRRLRP